VNVASIIGFTRGTAVCRLYGATKASMIGFTGAGRGKSGDGRQRQCGGAGFTGHRHDSRARRRAVPTGARRSAAAQAADGGTKCELRSSSLLGDGGRSISGTVLHRGRRQQA